MSKKAKSHLNQTSKETDQKHLLPSSPSLLFPFLERIISRPRFGIFFAGIYGFLMLFIGLTYHTVGDYNVETDFFWSYVPEAKQILLGEITIDGFRGPGYSILLALINIFARNYFIAGIILSTIAATVAIGISFYLIKSLLGTDKALFVSLLLAVNSLFIQYTYTAGTDMVFNAVMMASVFFFFRFENGKYINIIISAVIAGGAYLVRYNGIVAIVGFIVGVLFVNVFHRPWKERIKISLILAGTFFLVISPYGFYCYAQKGSFFYTENYLNIAREMYRDKLSHEQFWMSESAKYHSTMQVIMTDPGLFIRTILRNTYEHFIGDLNNAAGWQVGVFAIPGIILLWKERINKRLLTYFLLAAGFFGILLLLLQQPRYSLFLLPAYFVLGSLTVTWSGLQKFRIGKKLHIGSILAIVIIAWTCIDSYKYNRENIDSGPKEIPVISDLFHRTYGDMERGKKIITRKPHIAYYLDMTMVLFPYVQNEAELRQQVEASSASFLFFGTMEAAMRPQFQGLLYPQNAPSWLVPLVYTASPPAVLYKINFGSTP
jgi:Dolichyl-phosphate-mannose-protein mannosyltransferase